MRLAGYLLKNGKDPREIIVFKRDQIDEPGKMHVRYLVWNRNDPQFGVTNPSQTHAVGLPVRGNKKLILNFLDSIIRKGESKVCYKYIDFPAVEALADFQPKDVNYFPKGTYPSDEEIGDFVMMVCEEVAIIKKKREWVFK